MSKRLVNRGTPLVSAGARDRDLDLEMCETGGERRIGFVEADLDLDDAGVGAGGRVRAEDVLLGDVHRDPVDLAVERARQRRARHLGRGPEPTPAMSVS